MLSNRKLTFVNNQVYFQCRESTSNNEAMCAPGRDATSQAPVSVLGLIFQPELKCDFSDFAVLMGCYGARNMTFPSDTLRAAKGMLRNYFQLTNAEVFEGLPLALERSLLFYRDPASPTAVNVRRTNFRSFSWTGRNYVPVWRKFIEQGELECWIHFRCTLANGADRDVSISKQHHEPIKSATDRTWRKASGLFREVPISITDGDSMPSGSRTSPIPILHSWTVCINFRLINVEPTDPPWALSEYLLKAVDDVENLLGVIVCDLRPTQMPQQGQICTAGSQQRCPLETPSRA